MKGTKVFYQVYETWGGEWGFADEFKTLDRARKYAKKLARDTDAPTRIVKCSLVEVFTPSKIVGVSK